MAFEDRSCWYQSILLQSVGVGRAVLQQGRDGTRVERGSQDHDARAGHHGQAPVGVGVFAKRDGEVRLRYANDRLSTMFGDGFRVRPIIPIGMRRLS